MVSLQNGSKQDFFVQGQLGDMHYLGVMDGHGQAYGDTECIQYVRTLDFNFIASQPDPAQTIWDIIQANNGGKNFPGTGCTFTFARIDTENQIIEVWNAGDSETVVFLNDKVYRTESHTLCNHNELLRVKPYLKYIRQTSAPTVVSESEIEDRSSHVAHFSNGDTLVPTMCLGHQGVTRFAPHKQIIHYASTDRVRVVCVSDGVSDMKVDLSKGTAEEIANEADRKWKQGWTYKGYKGINFQTSDDITAVVWEKPELEVVEWPTICVPYAPIIFTEVDVRLVFDNIRKVDEFIVQKEDGKVHKVFFVHFNPGVLTSTMQEMYTKLAEGKPVKLWVREKWFWHLRISNHDHHVQKVSKIGWQYERWDRTGDYYEFAKDEIDTQTTLSLTTFLQSLA